MPAFRFLFPLLLAVAAATPAPAQTARDEEYARCMRLARSQPTEGFEMASGWVGRAGGLYARHCAAVALITMGQYAEGASRLETLATNGRGEAARLRVELLSQAAQGWLAAKMPERAHAALSGALRIAQDDADLWIDRAVVLASARNY